MPLFSMLKIDGIPGNSPREDGKFKDYFDLAGEFALAATTTTGNNLEDARFSLESVGVELIALLLRCTEEADNEKDITVERYLVSSGQKSAAKPVTTIKYLGANIRAVTPYFTDGSLLNAALTISYRELMVDGGGVKVSKVFSKKL